MFEISKNKKRKYPEANYELLPGTDKQKGQKKYLVEFTNYKEAKQAKDKLSESYDQELVEIDSALHQVKKENKEVRNAVKQNSNYNNEENSFEQKNSTKNNRNLFEIRVPKIILRNTSFKLNEDLLKKEMEKFGTVSHVHMPIKEDGKFKGYAFVMFDDKKDAAKAIESINSSDKKLMGTKMVADWCLPKNIFLRSKE